jgi:hypothetical protein
MPLVHWFRQKRQPALMDILLEPKTMQRGYFNRHEVQRRLLEHQQGIRDRSWELWHLMIFELWYRNFLEPATQRIGTPSAVVLDPQQGKQVQPSVSSKTGLEVGL